jgi:RHS repeat-associated protein
VTAASATTTYANDQLVVVHGAVGTFSASSWTAPSGTTERAQNNTTANASTGVADQTLGAAGATGTRTSTFGRSANLASVMVTLAPAPAISLVGTATLSGKSTSLRLTLPTGVAAKDQVVVATTQPSTTTVTTPSGYTLVSSVTSGGTSPLATTSVFRHTVVSGDTTVTLAYSTSTTAQAVVLAVYRGVDPNQPVDVTATGSASATTTVTAPSVTPAYASDQLVVFHGAVGTFSASTWTAPTGTTERAQNNTTANASAGVADQTLGGAGATGTRTSTFGKNANLDSVMVALAPPPAVLFLHGDQLGSTRLLTDSAGVNRGTSTFDAYGNVTASTGSSITPFGFSGEYRDAETGFIYLRGRYYDPATAQFLTCDPMVAATRSPYAYVAGNPLNATDPTGKGLFDIIFEAVVHALEPAVCPPSDELGSSGQPPECFPPGTTPTPNPTLDSHKGTATCDVQDNCWYTFPGGPAPRTIYVPGHQILTTDLYGDPIDTYMSPLYGPPGVRSWIRGRAGGASWVDPAHDPAHPQAFVWTPCAGGPDTQYGPDS